MEELKQLMLEGFAKLGTEIGEMKAEITGMKIKRGEMEQSQVRMEHKLDKTELMVRRGNYFVDKIAMNR